MTAWQCSPALYGTNVVIGYLTSAFLGWLGLRRRGLLGTAGVLMLTPLHWLLLSLAAWRALYQLDLLTLCLGKDRAWFGEKFAPCRPHDALVARVGASSHGAQAIRRAADAAGGRGLSTKKFGSLSSSRRGLRWPEAAARKNVASASIRLQGQHAAGADHQAPDFVGAELDLVGLRRLARQLDRVLVLAGRQIERRTVRRLGAGAGRDA